MQISSIGSTALDIFNSIEAGIVNVPYAELLAFYYQQLSTKRGGVVVMVLRGGLISEFLVEDLIRIGHLRGPIKN
jgi:hypothetical protein